MSERRIGAGLCERSQDALRPKSVRADELADPIASTTGDADTGKASALAGVRHLPAGQEGAGQFADRESARIAGALGGLAKARRAAELAEIPEYAKTLGLKQLGPGIAGLRDYLGDAKEFFELEVARMARDVGGGECSPAVSSIVATAALELAASRFCFAQGIVKPAMRLADASRQNLLAAHELAVREAQVRPRNPADQSQTLVAALTSGIATPEEPNK